MDIRDATEGDLPTIVTIYNSTISSRIVTADMEPVTLESRWEWFHSHNPHKRPLWVVEMDQEVVGWLGFQSFYGRPAYETTAELSVYVASSHHRRGIGQTLLQRAIALSPSLGIKTLLGFIFADNHPSLRLFEEFGFQRWGYLPGVAKFGHQEQDLVIVGLRLT